MNEKRKGEIAMAFAQISMREKLSLGNLAGIVEGIKRDTSRLPSEPEFLNIKATTKEIIEFIGIILENIFRDSQGILQELLKEIDEEEDENNEKEIL